jgi:hypothetical protein
VTTRKCQNCPVRETTPSPVSTSSWEEFRDRFWQRRKQAFADRWREVLEGLVERRSRLVDSIEHDEGVLSEARDKHDSAWNDRQAVRPEPVQGLTRS